MAQAPDVEFPLDRPVSPHFAGALAGIVDRHFLASEGHQKQHWRADRRGAHPDLLEFERVFRARMARLGVPVWAAEFIRSPERQNDLHAAGVSKAKGGQSAHQFGLAVDIVHGTKGWNMEPKAWALFGHVGKEIIKAKGLAMESRAWGGDWDDPDGPGIMHVGWDPAHWQLTDWKEAKRYYPFPEFINHAAYRRSLKD